MPMCADALRGDWCPLCYSGRRGRRAYKGHAGYRAFKPRLPFETEVREMKKPDQVAEQLRSSHAERSLCKELFPALFEHLTETRWDDGSRRETSSISVFVQDGTWKACLNDKDSGRTAFVSARSPDELLDVLEKAVATGSVEWKPYTGQGRGKRK